MVLFRALYFLLLGWWLALLWGLLATLLCATFVLLPLGAAMFNRLPQVLTLKPVERDVFGRSPARELPMLIRVVWFFVGGWWLGLMCFKLGYFLCLTILLMPVGVWVLHRVPVAMTLKQAA